MTRYLYTAEAAAVLRVDGKRAWRILREAGVRPVGKERPHAYASGGCKCIWSAGEVEAVAARHRRYPARERQRRASILRGIRCAKARRQACGIT